LSRHFRAEVLARESLTPRHVLLRLRPLENSLTPVPGQFYLLRVSQTLDPLLRRPFSIFSFEKEEISFLFIRKGRGTEILSNLRPSDQIEVFGPLGRGYPLPEQEATALVVAGGMGIASLFPLLKAIRKDTVLIYGAKTKSDILLKEQLNSLEYVKTIICTEDGTEGIKATVLEPLDDLLQRHTDKNITVYACGPDGMINAVKRMIDHYSLKGFFSLEERMACGLGACLGCVRKTQKGMKRVCREGPVFSGEEL